MKKKLENFDCITEDFYEFEETSIYYPLFDYLRIEIFSIICVFLWNYP